MTSPLNISNRLKGISIKTSLLIACVMILLASCQKDDRGLVVGKVKKASKLATTEFTIEKIVYGVKTKRLAWVVKLKGANFIAHSKAIVKAGINLDKLQAEDIVIEGKQITIKLPNVEVINFSYPAESFVMDTIISGNSLLVDVSLEDQEQFFRDAEIDIRNNLRYMGIREITEKKTIKMMESMLKTIGYDQVFISFHEGELIPEIDLGEGNSDDDDPKEPTNTTNP